MKIKHITQISILIAAMVLAAATSHAELIAYWKLDETSGTTAYDETANDHDGDINGATIDQDGKYGRAYSFDGEDDYVSVPDSPDWDFGTGDLAICFFFTKLDTDRAHALSIGTGSDNIDFDFDDTGYGAWVYWMGGGTPHVWTTNTYHDGNWHHIAFVREGDTFRLYMDGGLVDKTTDSSDIQTIGEGTIGGRASSSHLWEGKIDDIAVWDQAFNWDQIEFIYDHGVEYFEERGQVPEPASMLFALAGLGFAIKKKRRS